MRRLFELAKKECIIFLITAIVLECFLYWFRYTGMSSPVTFLIVIEIIIAVGLYLALRIGKIMKVENPKISQWSKAYFKFGLFMGLVIVPIMFYGLMNLRK